MNKIFNIIRVFVLWVIVFYPLNIDAQPQGKNLLDSVRSEIYNMGKMWTFDYPPTDYFNKTYHFSPDSVWYKEARLSALLLANYCSASFVSSDGLVMTNHHCARESGPLVQRLGENFNEDGFYAAKLTDERKVPELYVDQLLRIEDITMQVKSLLSADTSASGDLERRDAAFKKIIKKYKTRGEWQDLIIRPIQFYNGAKYSLYGYKRYKDVRLTFMPELMIGFYGGDYDNFTYPRYDLDCTFYRVYENGKPLKTDHYFKFSTNGASENEPVFVVGNPARTNRLYAVSDLEFQRDLSLPTAITLINDRLKVMYAYNSKAKNDSITNVIFLFENSKKAYNGQLDGLKDPYLMARKAAFERKLQDEIKNNGGLSDYAVIWDKIRNENNEVRQIYKTYYFFNSRPVVTGQLLAFANDLNSYASIAFANTAKRDSMKKTLISKPAVKVWELEKGFLAAYLKELVESFGKDDPIVLKALNGKTPEEAANNLLQTTKLNDPNVRANLLNGDSTTLKNLNDPLLEIARLSKIRYKLASGKYDSIQNRLFAYRNRLGNLLYQLYGTSISPDATSSLRISDGIVKGYAYNGTIAPPQTTFYGMYNRFYSFNKQYPWNLPKRWQNPPSELLPVPLDFVTTNDIIGGNSGSPIINKNREVVGLAFDGNIESLPGNFIYTPDKNRCVGVTSEAMLKALHYIYKAKRLEEELSGK
jgi:hypothetical protein